MWADGKFLHTKNMPQFLELGIGHFMEIEATGKAVFTSHGSEIRDDRGIETPERWQREAFQWVRKGGAPTVGQLTRLPATGTDTEFVHRVSSWSLISYLYGLYGPEKLGSFLNSMREGYDVPGAIAQTFQKTEAQLNYAWHLWVRSTRGRERQPQPGKGPTLEDVDAILEHFEQHWRGREKQDSDDITAAIETLVYLPPEISAPLLFDVIQRGSDVHASRAVEVLRRKPSAELAFLLAKEIDSTGRTDEQYLRHLVRCAGAFGSFSDLLFEQLTELRNAPSCPDLARAAIARTFGELEDERAIPALLEDTENIHHVIRAEAASALARVSPAEGKEKALKLLDDDSWHVRIAAVDIFEELREWDTVPALIEQLSKEAGRLREDILETLEELVGEGSSAPLESDDPRAWDAWWKRTGSALTGPVEAVARRSTEQRTVSPKPSQLLPPIYSKKFLMLVDVSASMQQHIWTSSEYSSKRKSQPKIDFVRDGLKLVIDEELSDDKKDLTSFNLWVFAPKVDRWKRKIAKSTARNKKNAKRWLDGLEFEDAHATDLHAVLERVMDAADEKLEDKARESFVDTLYLITDGMPTVGVTDTESLLAWTRDRNRMHRIRFNIVTIGATDTDLDFLDKLARENDGFLTNVGLH
ncbi:MAG: hypothetical protein CMJ89_03165 [Planctomycetes bacterium]|nr:hypothetical protein [Planctomycetota bacterium]